MKNIVELVKRSRCIHFAFIAFAAFVIFGDGLAQECGRKEWNRVEYKYLSGYSDNPASTDTKLVHVSALRNSDKPDKVELAVVAHHRRRRKSQTYALTTDSGRTWRWTASAIPSNLGYVPHWFEQAPSDRSVLYRLFDTSHLFHRSGDFGRLWHMPAYVIDGKTKEAFAEEIGGSNSYRLEMFLDAIHPTRPNTLFASFKVVPVGPDKLGWRNVRFVFRSTDGGQHWTKYNDELLAFPRSLGSGSPIGINPRDVNVYFGVGEKGLLKSSDAGQNWHVVSDSDELMKRPVYLAERQGISMMLGAPSSLEVYQFGFDQFAADIVYMVTNKGLFKSTNGGENWRLLSLGFDEIDSINSLAISPTNSKEFFVGTRYGVFKSLDGGCHFEKVFP